MQRVQRYRKIASFGQGRGGKWEGRDFGLAPSAQKGKGMGLECMRERGAGMHTREREDAYEGGIHMREAGAYTWRGGGGERGYHEGWEG